MVDADRHVSKSGSELQGCDSHCGSELRIGAFGRVLASSGTLYNATAFLCLLDSAIPAEADAADAADRIPNDYPSLS